jgi:hypothetical protein
MSRAVHDSFLPLGSAVIKTSFLVFSSFVLLLAIVFSIIDRMSMKSGGCRDETQKEK